MKRAIFLIPVCTLLVGACGKRESAAPPESPVADVAVEVESVGELDPIASPNAVRGGTLTTWAGPYPKSLNMWLDYNSFSKSVCELMFEGLVGLHPTKEEPVGILAESWEVSEDGKTFTFRIHPAAKWSDGRPITAEDVQFYYDVIMNPKNLTSLFRVDLSRFGRPEVVDERTIKITAQEEHWSNFWTAAGLVAFPKHAWADVDFNAQNSDFPIVSGPYQLDEVKTNRSISLKRRGDWWGRIRRNNAGKYNFDYLVFRALEDRDKALELLKKGELDVLPVYTARIWAEKTDFPQVQKNWIVRQKIANQEPKAFQGLALNMRRSKFSDPLVRRALSHLLNRELMNEKIMFNQYFLLNSYYPDLYPDNVNPNSPLVDFNPGKARELLQQAGYVVNDQGLLEKDGEPLSITILHHGDVLPQLNIFLEDLKNVGINATIDLVSRATHSKRVDNHDFDMVWQNWGATRLRDPESMWSSAQANEIATQNITGLQDAEIDRLIELQKTEMDLAKRNDILRQIDARLIEINPYILMWQSPAAHLLYWNKFGTPKYVLDKYNREDAIPVYWWLDPAKLAALQEAMQTNTALPPEPADVSYTE